MYYVKNYYKDFESIALTAKKAANTAKEHKVEDFVNKELSNLIEKLQNISKQLQSGQFGIDNVLTTYTSNLNTIISKLENIYSSLQSDYKNAENIYVELDKSLDKLKETTDTLNNISSREPSKPVDIDEEFDVKYAQWQSEHRIWNDKVISLKNCCEELVSKIYEYMDYLKSINGWGPANGKSGITIPSTNLKYQSVIDLINKKVFNLDNRTIMLGSSSAEIFHLLENDSYDEGYYVYGPNEEKYQLVNYDETTGKFTKFKLNGKNENPAYANSVEFDVDGKVTLKDIKEYYDNDEMRIKRECESKIIDKDGTVILKNFKQYYDNDDHRIYFQYESSITSNNVTIERRGYKEYYDREDNNIKMEYKLRTLDEDGNIVYTDLKEINKDGTIKRNEETYIEKKQ